MLKRPQTCQVGYGKCAKVLTVNVQSLLLLILEKSVPSRLEEVTELVPTKRGDGGFGSSDKVTVVTDKVTVAASNNISELYYCS